VEDLEAVGSVFYDSESVLVRRSIIQLLTSSDTAYVVRDDSTCQAVLDRALPYLRQHMSTWKEGQKGNFEATVYRFGPYYAVQAVPEDSLPQSTSILDLVVHDRSASLLIYRASDLTLLRVLA
jgi:hypothetical protein